MRVLVVDDEPLARGRLLDLLARHDDVEVVGECRNGMEAIDAVRRETPDLVFLDVQMPEAGGFDVLGALDERELPIVVFVSAYDEHALRAFEAHALDYLLKPFDDDRFAGMLDRVRHEIDKGQALAIARRLGALRAEITNRALERIPIRSRRKTYFVSVADIESVRSAGVYAEIHALGTAHLARTSLSELEARLPEGEFVRVHRTAIVALSSVAQVEAASHGDATIRLKSGDTVRLSRRYRAKLRERMAL